MNYNEEDIRKTYRFLNHNYQTEIRLIDPHKKRSPISIFVENEYDFIKECIKYNGIYNIYAGINERNKNCTEGKEVISVKTIVIDIDPKRDKNTASTIDELNNADIIASQIQIDMLEKKYEKPLKAMSGNGYQLWFSIPEIKITEENREMINKKIQYFNKVLIKKYSNKECNIDNIGDLPRIIKVIGTLSIKGINTEERPHRVSFWADKSEIKRNEDENLKNYILMLDDLDTGHDEISDEELSFKKISNAELEKIIKCDEKIMELLNGNLNNYKSRSEAEMSLIVKLLTYNIEKEQIYTILNNSKIGKWKESKNQYKELTYNKALDFYKKNLLTKHKKILLPSYGRLVSDFSSELGEYFKDKNILFFRCDDNTIVKLDKNSNNIQIFMAVKPPEFITIVENQVTPGVYIKNKNLNDYEFKEKSLSKTDAELCMESNHFKDKLPRIKNIYTVPIPILSNGKIILPKIGYDDDLKSWLSEDSPKIKDDMSIEEAKKIIDFMLSEFCFKKEQDKINAIAALLTPLCRGLFERRTCRTPIILYSANTPRAGKDYLAGLSGLIYEGVSNEDQPISNGQGSNEEELRKKITSIFMSGRRRYHSSNNKGYLNSAVLEALATKEYYSDRILGTNKNVIYPNDLEISISANIGLTYTTDFSKRCLLINLFYDEEDPNSRKFKNPMLHNWVLNNRSEIISAFYTLIRIWHENGMPDGSIKFASYPEWARVIGGIMECAGYENPCIENEGDNVVGGDTKIRDMKMLFEIGYDKYNGEWIKKSDIINDLMHQGGDFEGLFDYLNWSEVSARMRFGKLFDTFNNRWLGDIKVINDGNARAARRKYKFVKRKDDKIGVMSGFNTK